MSAVLKQQPILLRPMAESDLDTVLAIEQDAYRFPWSLGIFRDCLRMGYSTWVLELDGIIEGYGIISVGAGESHLLNLCVRRHSQRLGLGRALLEHLLKVAREHHADSMFLEVRPSNQCALQLYRRMGFTEVGTRRAYYPARQSREDALILARQLVTADSAWNL